MNVSQVGSTSRNGGGNRTQQIKKTGPEDDKYDPSTNYSAHKVDSNKYYNTNDWNHSLNKNQRNYLRQNNRGNSKRKARSGSSNTSEVKTEALKAMQKKQKVMEATIASLQASHDAIVVDSDDMDESSEEEAPRKKKNTKPLQLKRKKR